MKASSASKTLLGKSLVIQVIKSLSKDELRGFEKFVRSPYHNNRREVIEYYSAIKKFYPAFDHPDFTKEKIYNKLHPGGRYRDDIIRLLNSYLLKCLRNYLIIQKIEKDEFLQQQFYLEQVVDRNIDSEFEREYFYTNKLIDRNGISEEYYKFKAEIETLAMIQYKKKSQGYNEGRRYYKVPEYWLSFALQKYFRGLENLIAISNSFVLKQEQGLLSTFMNCFDENKFISLLKTEYPDYFNIIGITYYPYKMQASPQNEEHFFSLLELLRKEYNIYNKQMLPEIYSNLEEYCSYKYSEENVKKFHKIKFELIKEMDEKGIFGSESKNYINIIGIENSCYCAMGLGEYDWAKYFLEKYSVRIEPSLRENTVNLFMAEYYYFKKDYDTALKHLIKTTYKTVFDNVRIKGLLIRIYYDTGDTEPLLAAIDSARHAVLVKRNKSNKWMLITFSKFLNIMEKMSKLRENMNYNGIVKLKEYIMNSEQVVPRPWLLKRINDLEEMARDKSLD